jgi:hypothetical protein
VTVGQERLQGEDGCSCVLRPRSRQVETGQDSGEIESRQGEATGFGSWKGQRFETHGIRGSAAAHSQRTKSRGRFEFLFLPGFFCAAECWRLKAEINN